MSSSINEQQPPPQQQQQQQQTINITSTNATQQPPQSTGGGGGGGGSDSTIKVQGAKTGIDISAGTHRRMDQAVSKRAATRNEELDRQRGRGKWSSQEEENAAQEKQQSGNPFGSYAAAAAAAGKIPNNNNDNGNNTGSDGAAVDADANVQKSRTISSELLPTAKHLPRELVDLVKANCEKSVIFAITPSTLTDDCVKAAAAASSNGRTAFFAMRLKEQYADVGAAIHRELGAHRPLVMKAVARCFVTFEGSNNNPLLFYGCLMPKPLPSDSKFADTFIRLVVDQQQHQEDAAMDIEFAPKTDEEKLDVYIQVASNNVAAIGVVCPGQHAKRIGDVATARGHVDAQFTRNISNTRKLVEQHLASVKAPAPSAATTTAAATVAGVPAAAAAAVAGVPAAAAAAVAGVPTAAGAPAAAVEAAGGPTAAVETAGVSAAAATAVAGVPAAAAAAASSTEADGDAAVTTHTNTTKETKNKNVSSASSSSPVVINSDVLLMPAERILTSAFAASTMTVKVNHKTKAGKVNNVQLCTYFQSKGYFTLIVSSADIVLSKQKGRLTAQDVSFVEKVCIDGHEVVRKIFTDLPVFDPERRQRQQLNKEANATKPESGGDSNSNDSKEVRISVSTFYGTASTMAGTSRPTDGDTTTKIVELLNNKIAAHVKAAAATAATAPPTATQEDATATAPTTAEAANTTTSTAAPAADVAHVAHVRIVSAQQNGFIVAIPREVALAIKPGYFAGKYIAIAVTRPKLAAEMTAEAL